MFHRKKLFASLSYIITFIISNTTVQYKENNKVFRLVLKIVLLLFANPVLY